MRDDVKGHTNWLGQRVAEIIMLKMDGTANKRHLGWQNGVVTGGVGWVREKTIHGKWTELNVNRDV